MPARLPAWPPEPAALQGEHPDAGRDQEGADPALPANVLVEDEPGEDRFEEVAGGGGGNGEAEVGDGEEREQGKEADSHSDDAAEDVLVPGKGRDEAADRGGIKLADLAVASHAVGVEEVADAVGGDDQGDQSPLHRAGPVRGRVRPTMRMPMAIKPTPDQRAAETRS